MDKSVVQAIVGNNLAPLKQFLGLDEWDIVVKFESMGGRISAEIDARPDYRLATITMAYDVMDTDDEIVDTLFHELCHLIHWPFDHYRLLVIQQFPSTEESGSTSSSEIRTESAAWTIAIEAFVRNLERIWKYRGWREQYIDQFTRPTGH